MNNNLTKIGNNFYFGDKEHYSLNINRNNNIESNKNLE